MTIKKPLCLLLAFSLAAIPCLAQVQVNVPQVVTSSSDYAEGRMAGESAATGSFLWFFAGFCCGCLGVGACYLFDKPTPPSSAFIGRSGDFVTGFNDGYRAKKKNRDAMMAWIGCGVAAVLNVIVYAMNPGTYSSVYDY
jgi:hypothetical protein